MKTAVITGAKGQDASYLAELLLEKGYRVVAIYRRTSNSDFINIQHLFGNENYILEQGDITDMGSVTRIVQQYQPDEFYNLAAMSYVGASWNESLSSLQVNFNAVANCLEAIRQFSPKTRFYQASTSEVFGDVLESPQGLQTEARPRSPYGAAKHGAESLVKIYKESYGLYACWARCFNHESPRRGKEFVSRKITNYVAKYADYLEDHVVNKTDNPLVFGEDGFRSKMHPRDTMPYLKLGNLEAQRDWTHARDIIRGQWMMLQQDEPKNYVMASGQTQSISKLLDVAFGHVGINDWSNCVKIDPKFYRPAEVNLLLGDYSEIEKDLGWKPEISFEGLVKEMVDADRSQH